MSDTKDIILSNATNQATKYIVLLGGAGLGVVLL